MPKVSLEKRDLLALFILLVLSLLFFNQVLFGGKTFFYRDFFRLIYPMNHFVYHSIREGEVPLWNPYLSCGTPVMIPNTYPLTILMVLFPFEVSLDLFIVFHYLLAGFSLYLFLKELKVSTLGSIIGGLVFTFSGYLISCIDLTLILVSIAWIPLIFLFINKAIDSSIKSGMNSGLWYFFLGALVISLQFLGGTPEIVYISGITLFLFFLERCYFYLRPIGPNKKKGFLKLLFAFSFMIFISAILSSFRLFSFLELFRYSEINTTLNYKEATSQSLSPYELVNLVIPFFSGFLYYILHLRVQSLIMSIYMGIIPFLLILIAIFYQRRLDVLFWTILFLGASILSLGDHTILYHILYRYFPLFSMIRYPVKFFSIALFSGAVLSGFGFMYVEQVIRQRDYRLNLFYAVNLVLLLFSLIFLVNRDGVIDLLKETTNTDIKTLDRGYTIFTSNLWMTTLFLTISSFLTYFIRRRMMSHGLFLCLIIPIIITDLFNSGVRLTPLVRHEFYEYESETLKLLKEDKDYFRLFLSPETASYYAQLGFRFEREFLFEICILLIPDLALVNRIFEASSYNIRPGIKRYEDFLNVIKSNRPSHLIDLVNIKYIISKFEIYKDGIRMVYHHPETGIRLYMNPTYLPRAFLVPEVLVMKDSFMILNKLLDPNFDPKKEVIIEEEVKKTKRLLNPRLMTPEIIDYRPNKVVIKADPEDECFLFLSDTYYPGWEAYIDGIKTKIYRANYCFRAIKLKEGRHIIEFIYRPKSFMIGIIGSITILISLLGWGLINKTRLLILNNMV